METKESICVAGVRFSADQVKEVTINVGGRTVYISEPGVTERSVGFVQEEKTEEEPQPEFESHLVDYDKRNPIKAAP